MNNYARFLGVFGVCASEPEKSASLGAESLTEVALDSRERATRHIKASPPLSLSLSGAGLGYTEYHSKSVATYVPGSAAMPASIAAFSSAEFLRILNGFFITNNRPVIGCSKADHAQSSLTSRECDNMKTRPAQHKTLNPAFGVVAARIRQIACGFPFLRIRNIEIDAVMRDVDRAFRLIPFEYQHIAAPYRTVSYRRFP